MILARIDGNAVATVAHPSLKGLRLLICQPIDSEGNEVGEPSIAFDEQGAGLHSKVFFTTDGSAARDACGDEHSPLRNMVAGVVDDVKGGPA